MSRRKKIKHYLAGQRYWEVFVIPQNETVVHACEILEKNRIGALIVVDKKDDLEVYHVDLYRISSIHEFYDLDLPLFKENTLFFIEWSDLLPTANLDNWRLITIEVIDENTRKISY